MSSQLCVSLSTDLGDSWGGRPEPGEQWLVSVMGTKLWSRGFFNNI